MSKQQILVVDDEPDIRELIKDILDDEGYEVLLAANGEETHQQLKQHKPDLILLDIWMPDIDGISLMHEWRNRLNALPCPVIIMSGHGTVEHAVEATRLGAYDFLEKPLSMAKLLLVMERALASSQQQKENQVRSAHIVHEPVGHSGLIQQLRGQAQKIAQHTAPVLILGEAGVGKEVIAHYIHQQSPRVQSSLIEIGVATISGQNSTLELFGGEDNGQIYHGLLERASNGTLLLQSIMDMDAETQAKLASTLSSGFFMRVGGSQPIEIQARIICTAQPDLTQRVAQNLFREDLFYQLNVLPISVPSLREHLEDVPELLSFYVNYFVEEGLSYRKFSTASQNLLRNYPWPGNVRELRNLVQRLLIFGTQEEITPDEVNTALMQTPMMPMPDQQEEDAELYDMPLREAREQFERAYLLYQLKACEGNVAKLAEKVGMERTNLYRKLRSLDIDPKKM